MAIAVESMARIRRGGGRMIVTQVVQEVCDSCYEAFWYWNDLKDDDECQECAKLENYSIQFVGEEE